MADFISDNRLRAYDVIGVILDTFGPDGVWQIIPLLEQPATVFLCVARHVADRQLEEELGSARSWALKAVRHGTAAGALHAVLSFGVDVNEVVCSWPEEAREVLVSLTRRVQEPNILWEITDSWVRDARGESDDRSEDADLFVWLDVCTAAAHRDPLSLNAAEALIVGEGWYRCWLRFTIGLARTEAAHAEDRASLAVEAIRHLATDLEPFSGEPRACDLFSIHPTIQQTIRRAMRLVDDERWSECIETLYNASSSITTTIRGEIGGPIPSTFVLDIAVERGTESGARRRRSTHSPGTRTVLSRPLLLGSRGVPSARGAPGARRKRLGRSETAVAEGLHDAECLRAAQRRHHLRTAGSAVRSHRG